MIIKGLKKTNKKKIFQVVNPSDYGRNIVAAYFYLNMEALDI